MLEIATAPGGGLAMTPIFSILTQYYFFSVFLAISEVNEHSRLEIPERPARLGLVHALLPRRETRSEAGEHFRPLG